MKQVIEYGARYPDQLTADSKYVTRGPIDEKEANGITRYINARLRQHGLPETAYVVERVVQYSEWEAKGSVEAEAMRGGITL